MWKADEEVFKLYQQSSMNDIDNLVFSVEMKFKPDLWNDFPNDEIWNNNWIDVKYMNKNKRHTSKYSKIPSEGGGIFIWVVKPYNIKIPDYSFIAYIGNSEKNLKASIENFASENSNTKYNGNFTKRELFEKFPLCLYVKYLKCDDYDKTKKIIEKLVNIIDPPIQETIISLQQGEEAF